MNTTRQVERLLRQQAALARFGSFAFGEPSLQAILSEAARICAECLDVPFSKICRHRSDHDDLLIVAGFGWQADIVGHVVSQADETSTQGRAFVTGEPVILENTATNNSYRLPPFYAQHGVVSTVDVLIKGTSGPFGVLEADSTVQRSFDTHDINFLTGFANVVAEAAGTAERTASLRAALAELQKLTEENSTLAAELQHRVRNNLQLVYGMLVRQVEASEDSGKEGIRAIARRVMTLSRIYDHLLGHGLVQTIDFGAYLGSLCTSLSDFQEKGPFEVKLICDAGAMALPLDLVTALGIIVTEITSNAYLHAFKSGPGTIRASLVRNGDNGNLTISDDGAGFAAQDHSKRHGVGLIRRLMEQENGSAELITYPGTTWKLAFAIGSPPVDREPLAGHRP